MAHCQVPIQSPWQRLPSPGRNTGVQETQPVVPGPWTCSIQSPGPLHHSCSGSFKPSHPCNLFLFPGFLTTSAHPFTWKNELCQFELGLRGDSANWSLNVQQGTARACCCHPENTTFISCVWSLPAIQAGFSAWRERGECWHSGNKEQT